MQDSMHISCQAVDAFHRTVFVRMFETVFSLIRSPHGKTPNMKDEVCRVLYKFRLETFLFRTSELGNTSRRKWRLEVENCYMSCTKSAQPAQAFRRTLVQQF